MGDTDFHDPYGILPESFKQRYADCDSVDDALRKAENSPGTTSNDQKERCPNCRSVRIRSKKLDISMPHRIDEHAKKCTGCNEHFSDPRPPLEECPVEYAWKWLDDQQRYRDIHTKTMPINTPFQWLSSTDLEDPAERGMSPLFGDLDEETRVALAIALYEPWTDDGPGYRQLAELFPHGRAWIGSRVREWKDGEHRDLVEEPGPTVDATGGADAIATDGGRRRWEAYGS